MAWFRGLRVIVYLKRISQALERIATFTDAQMPSVPKRSRRSLFPDAEVMKPTTKDWNQRWREEHPDEYERLREDM